MSPEAEKLLFDMAQAGRNVLQFVAGRTGDEYVQDLLLRSAVERQLFILGEALTQLRNADPATAAQVPGHRIIIGFRNLLAHAYAAVDDRRVWDIVENSLPATLAAVEALLPQASE
jgi:uncharacterized protein with HEPN domain